MKRSLFLLLSLFVLAFPLRAAHEAEWKKVDRFMGKKLPRSALALLGPMEAAARTAKDWPEVVRTVATRILIESQLEADQPEGRLKRLDALLAGAPPEMLPVLQVLAAEWFYEYFYANSWPRMSRTRGAGGDDIAAWDNGRLVAETEARFVKALSAAPVLRQIPVAHWGGLLPAGALPDSYQPTLYDFVAGEALTFYTMARQTVVALDDAIGFDANSPALGSMEEFLAWQPEQGNLPKALRLFQEVLTFHKGDADPGALVMLDLQRLEWVREQTGEQANARALKQYTALYKKHAAHEISLRARSLAAHVLDRDKKSAEARRVLQEGLGPFEKSVFAPRCREQIRGIEDRELSVDTEFVWNAARPEIVMKWRNLPQVFFRAYLVSENPSPPLVIQGRYPDSTKVKRMLKVKPLRAWQVDLPPADDFLEHEHRVAAPADLKPGYYLLCASGNAAFTAKGNQITATYVWVTPLALVIRERATAGADVLDAWVLDAVSGEPVKDAEVTLWRRPSQKDPVKQAAKLTTGEDGFVTFTPEPSDSVYLFAKLGGNTALSEEMKRIYHYDRDGSAQPGEEDLNTTYFFTDRTIYRPGQTIQFKGIHVHCDPARKDWRTLPDIKRRVVLRDANNRELAALDVTTNAFGSFSGSFTAPSQLLTGWLYIGDSKGGGVSVHVEEYKRPKFKVELDPPAAAPKLGEEVSVKVRALAYTGAPVDHADVSWTVKRRAQWPSWFSYRKSYDDQEIDHGETTTGADGSVEIKFRAVPDKSIAESSEAWFSYQIQAAITDTAGETRTEERSVTAGYVAMKAELSADEWQSVARPVAITVSTADLDGEPQSAEGTLTVHRLVPPDRVHRREKPIDSDRSFGGLFGGVDRRAPSADNPDKDLSYPSFWETGEAVQKESVKTDAKGTAVVNVKLAAGAWRALLETKDRFGRKITAQREIIAADPEAKTFPVRVPFRVEAPAWELQPGSDFTALWSTGYDQGRAYIEIEHERKIIQHFWTEAGRTQQSASLKVTEEFRGGFTLHVTQMRENRLSTVSKYVSVPWSNKDLHLKWEHLTSKLEPGAQDTWTLSVEGPAREKASAEMAAVLYDASLEALKPHEWPHRIGWFYEDPKPEDRARTPNGDFQDLSQVVVNWWGPYESYSERGRTWAWIDTGSGDLTYPKYGGGSGTFELMRRQKNFSDEFDAPQIPQTFGGSGGFRFTSNREPSVESAGEPAGPLPDLSKVSARRNLQETAFFFPHLTTADDGTVKMSFTMPESVTTWKFLGLAHDKELRSGFLDGESVTARDLMVQPNPPRFLREGDEVEFTVKITNQSAAPQQGTAQLNFSDAATLAPADAALGNQKLKQGFSVPAKESRTLSWRITVPDGQGFLAWKAVAATEKMSDGEEGWLPVLSRRIALTESIAMPLRDAGTKEFAFKKLMESAASPTLRHQSLTVQMVSQPAWYAVLALPYLMEYPHECSEQTFNRYYANALARHIAKSSPKIHRVFEVWRDAQPEAMKSPLEKNGELKSVMIEETPWLREAKADSRSSLGVLFDDNRLDDEMLRTLKRLKDLQAKDGTWAWFPGGPPSEFITLYILAGFGRLQHLGVELPGNPAVNALDQLDVWLAREYSDISKHKSKNGNHLTSMIALYLYGRSFYLGDVPVPPEHREVTDYFLEQARRHWMDLSRMSQAHAALGLLRFGDAKTAAAIAASLKERAVKDEETGMHWADGRDQWMWNEAPVETQAMMIEAFREIAQDARAVDDCQVWLLKQKQTHAWSTTKATADACYAILLGGADKLSSDALVAVSLGGREVKPEKVEAGTGFFARTFAPAEIKADMGTVKLVKPDKGIAWGSVHWQYLEEMDRITPHEGTPLKVTKALFIKVNTGAGAELRPVQGKVKVGDELVVRLELRTDRDMEFVHLKDQRPSSVEPVNVLSEYKWQDRLGYYESTRDTASHFFFDALPKGTYVFEYSARVQLRGACQSGVAELQCMYAPEFNSHSASSLLEVE